MTLRRSSRLPVLLLLVALAVVLGLPAAALAARTELAAQAAPAEQDVSTYAGTYQVSLPAADSPGRTITAVLTEDGTLEVTTDFEDGRPPIVETGQWTAGTDGGIVVTLTGHGGRTYYRPQEYVAMLDLDTDELVVTGQRGVQITMARITDEQTPVAEEAAPAPEEEATPEAEMAVTETEAAAVEAAPVITPTATMTETTTAAAEPSEQGLKDTYFTFRPAASGGGTVFMALNLYEDGTAEFISEYHNDEPPVIEVGTWMDNDDGTITVTLTGQLDRTYEEPEVITFQVEGEYLVALDAEERFGSEGLRLRESQAVARGVESSLFTIDLTAGFPLDPTFISVNGGGEVDASFLGGECSGFVNEEPVVTVNWAGTSDFVEAFVVSDHDPTLIVLTPDGQVLCNDNANEHLLDPVIEISNPPEGKYRIWVGSADVNQLIPGVLVLTTRPEVNLGTFDLGGLIQRPLLPEVLAQPTPDPAVAAVAKELEARMEEAAELAPGDVTLTAEISSEGTLPLFAIPELEARGCSGLVMSAPDFMFQVPEGTEMVRVFFEGQVDSSLLVVNRDEGVVVCSDDSPDGQNLNPFLELTGPPVGMYAVYVGRLDASQPVVGLLTITEEQAEPAQLAPAPGQ